MNRQQKINLLRGIQTGTRAITELIPKTFKVTLYQEDPNDPEYLIQFNQAKGTEPGRMSRNDYEQSKADYKITLNLQA